MISAVQQLKYKMGNLKYLKTKCGVLKILTIILGSISVGLTAYACDQEWKEEVYLGIAITCLIISLLYLIFHSSVPDIELKSLNKGLDSGYHFLGALFLLCGGILMIYSAVDLHYDIWYFCTYGIGRGIPCLYNKQNNNRDYYPNNPNGISNIPTTYYGVKNSGISAKSFLHPKWFTWLGAQNICYEILPRLFDCNRYYELKLAGGILGILNSILYGVTGIVVLLNN